jgi:hypothetical protein
MCRKWLCEGIVQVRNTVGINWSVPVWVWVSLLTAGVFGAQYFHFFLHFGGCASGVELLDLALLSLLRVGPGEPGPGCFSSSFSN